MIATRAVVAEYGAWNRRWGAPFGHRFGVADHMVSRLPERLRWRLRGPFSIQPNNTTRAFEYPWAFHVAALQPSSSILEIGGGLSGFQFALAREGHQVVNVDPGEAAKGKGWRCDAESVATLNSIFGTSVELRPTTINEAGLPSAAFDRAFCLSVIEHLPPSEADDVVREVKRVLKPGGLFILTTDLFLDIQPFTDQERNRYGRNYPIGNLLADDAFEVVLGTAQQLYGHAQFSPNAVLRSLPNWLLGAGYPCLVQCLVLKKRQKLDA